jgi:hypothetical protein
MCIEAGPSERRVDILGGLLLTTGDEHRGRQQKWQ